MSISGNDDFTMPTLPVNGNCTWLMSGSDYGQHVNRGLPGKPTNPEAAVPSLFASTNHRRDAFSLGQVVAEPQME